MEERQLKRTFIENPKAWLDQYTVEDALRDINYSTDKIKLLVEALYKEFPGFIVPPTITINSQDPNCIDIGEFSGINIERDVIIKGPTAKVYPGVLPYGDENKQWIVVRIVNEQGEEQRRNPGQQNRNYNYIIQEKLKFEFTTEEPINDLIIGVVWAKEGSNNEYLLSASIIGQSPLLPGIEGGGADTLASKTINLEPGVWATDIIVPNENSTLEIRNAKNNIYGRFLLRIGNEEVEITELETSPVVRSSTTPEYDPELENNVTPEIYGEGAEYIYIKAAMGEAGIIVSIISTFPDDTVLTYNLL